MGQPGGKLATCLRSRLRQITFGPMNTARLSWPSENPAPRWPTRSKWIKLRSDTRFGNYAVGVLIAIDSSMRPEGQQPPDFANGIRRSRQRL